MRGLDLESLLRRIAEVAQRREPLAPGLRSCGLVGAADIADALDRGLPLPEALRAVADPLVCEMLAGPRPPLSEAALMAAEDIRLDRERRALMHDLLMPAVATLVVVVAIAGWLWWHGQLAYLGVCGWYATAAIVVLGAHVALIRCSPHLADRFPVLLAWRRHAELAQLYTRAALMSRWRLPESELVAWFGGAVARLVPLFGREDAEAHCLLLAEYHRDAAKRSARRQALLVQVALYLAAAAVVLAIAAHQIEPLTTAIRIELGADGW